METDRLGIKPAVLFSIYSEVDSRARKLSCGQYSNELQISREGKDATRFHIAVTERMAPNLISSVQEIINETGGIELKSHFQRLQELLMAEMFAGAKDVIQIG
jgi:hypothetical protein